MYKAQGVDRNEDINMKFGRLTGNCECPVCSKQCDGFVDPNDNGANPKSGDLTLCIYCNTFLQFMDDGLRVAPESIVNQLVEADRNRVTNMANKVRKARIQ